MRRSAADRGRAAGGVAAAASRAAPAAFVQLVVDDLSADRVVLGGSEARHLARALRARPGESYRATDGRGTRAEVVVGPLGRDRAELEVIGREWEAPPALRFWVATACDAPRMEWLCEKAAELGAWGLLPLEAQRGGARTERLRRIARAALGQSLGAFALEVAAPAPLPVVLAGPPGGSGWELGIWADPGGAPLGACPEPGSGDVLLLAGPPSGFSEADRALLEAFDGGFRAVLGDRRLRSETAALALLAWWALGRQTP